MLKENKDIKKYREVRGKIKYLVKQKNNDADYDDSGYINIKNSVNNNLPLNRWSLMFDVMIFIRSNFKNYNTDYSGILGKVLVYFLNKAC